MVVDSCGWHDSSRRVWSLWDMFTVNAHAILHLFESLIDEEGPVISFRVGKFGRPESLDRRSQAEARAIKAMLRSA